MARRFAAALAAGLVFLAAGTTSGRAADGPAATLTAGTMLGKDNWELAKDLLPPEIARHYKDGDYSNPVIDWPVGTYNWNADFKAASEANRGRYALNASGTIIDTATGQQPPYVYGLPFPDIDPKASGAGLMVLWNFLYQYWNEGNSHNVTLLNWVSPTRVDRESTQDVYFLYYDGQNPAYRLPNPNNYSMQYVSVATSPADLNGTASLTWRYRDSTKRDSNWAYVPALRRVRAVSPANRSDGFLGSDMSQDDGPFFDGKPEDFTWRMVGEADMLCIVDPHSFSGDPHQYWMDKGGWRSIWPETPVVGYQDPAWHGIAWAPIPAALTRRPCWVVEAVPKDKYYLYGKIQLYIDKETFQGAWTRKFGWTGELLNTLQVTMYQKQTLQRPDGTRESMWASSFTYQCAENVKMNRATLAGLTVKGKDVPNDRRVTYDPSFFDFNTLQRFGK